MTLRLYKDNTVDLRLDEIVDGLNRVSNSSTYVLGKSKFSVRGEMISCPSTYDRLGDKVKDEIKNDYLAVLFTEKPYDNNYFFESPVDSPFGRAAIVSLYGWDHLTSLSRNNGAVYFICALLVRALRVGYRHDTKNTGCINDFWHDKSGIDIGMRAGYICKSCTRGFESRKTPQKIAVLESVQKILDELSVASRGAADICDVWCRTNQEDPFDVFLCHNSKEKHAVRQINALLQKRKVATWLDEEQLPPGRAWQDLLEQQIQSIKSVAVFVGESGIGPWQNVEIRAFLGEFVARQCPVIPVILRECEAVPQLPLFMRQFTWVDFRRTSPDPLRQLMWGITGVRPVNN